MDAYDVDLGRPTDLYDHKESLMELIVIGRLLRNTAVKSFEVTLRI
jgi:hypothetical protein